MTKPVYKIETLTGAVSDHVITDDATFYYKDVLTDGVGTFSFTVPTERGGNYLYDDIALNDKVKMWLAYGSVGATPNFVGKVTSISAPLTTQQGYVRTISGLSQGEVLLRRYKTNKYWQATAVSGAAGRIVNVIASDLGLGTGDIASETQTIDYELRAKSYFDVLRDIADYWVSAGTQLKYDFYVDVDNDLVWKARPIRAAGVEILTVGDNIKSYTVTRDAKRVKNSITVYGAAEKMRPTSGDSWTESSSGDWTLQQGDSLADDTAEKQVGANSLRGHAGVSGDKIEFKREDLGTLNIATINRLHFWRRHSPQAFLDGPYLRVLAPDESNYYHYTFSTGVGDAAWSEKILTVGSGNEYDADSNTEGEWYKQGSPNWWDIQGFEVYMQFADVNCYVWIDGLYLHPDRWSDTASDATSQTTYGQRDLIVKDDKLHSDGDCEKRSETMLYQMKDPPTQIDVVLKGNDNVLIGDRLPMTIPAENISAANYDVIVVANYLDATGGWTTSASMVNSANTREAITVDSVKALSDLRRELRQFGQDYYKRLS